MRFSTIRPPAIAQHNTTPSFVKAFDDVDHALDRWKGCGHNSISKCNMFLENSVKSVEDEIELLNVAAGRV